MFVPLCDGLRGGAKRYMLMGPSVRKADSSFIRLYYTKRHTPRHAHTCMYTQSIRSTCYTKRHRQTHHTKEGNREHLNPSVLEDGVCLYISGIHLGWSRMTGIVVTSLGSDSWYWWQRLSQYFILKGKMDWSSLCLAAFASVVLLPQYTPEKAHIEGVMYWHAGCEVGKNKRRLSAQVEALFETKKETKWCYHQVVTWTWTGAGISNSPEGFTFWSGKSRNLFILSGRSKQTETDQIRLRKHWYVWWWGV